MKFLVAGGAAAFLGISLFPGLIFFIGASVIAVFITVFVCRHVEIEFDVVEKTLISLLLNVCLAVGGGVILPSILGMDADESLAIFLAAGSFVGTFLGGILSEFTEPEK